MRSGVSSEEKLNAPSVVQKLSHRINRVGRTAAREFHVTDPHAVQRGKGRTGHLQTKIAVTQRTLRGLHVGIASNSD